MNAIIRVLVCYGLLAISDIAAAQTWPSRPIKLIVPVAPGGGMDVLSRPIADRLSSRLGQPVVIQNNPGASMLIATQIASRAAPDGYTLLVASSTALSSNSVLFKTLGYDPVNDFTPVAMIADSIAMVVSNNSGLPIKTFPELLEFARANPGRITYAVDEASSFATTIGKAIELKAGIQMLLVPYKAASQALEDTVAGRTDVLIGPLGLVEGFVKSGELRRLAVATSTRFPSAPDVPTIGETLPGFALDGFIAIVTPSGTPEPMIDRLNRELTEVMKDPEIVAHLLRLGYATLGAGTRDQITATIRTDRELWKRLAAELKIEPQ